MILSPFQHAAVIFSGLSGESHIHELKITSIKGGLINQSYLVRPKNAAAFLLQQINKNVFKNPFEVQQNYLQIWNDRQTLRLPNPILYKESISFYIDEDGNFWRAFEFIEHTVSPLIASNPVQAKATAKTFGSFTASFSNFDTGQLKIVIPDFHNLQLRYEQYSQALMKGSDEQKAKAGIILEKLSERSFYKDFYESVVSQPTDFPKRVMHHDAKIANVLFDVKSGEVVCPVDFDTVMPGYFFSDLGDMIRSMACNHDENYHSSDPIRIKPEYYQAIVDGYLQVMKERLTEAEIEHIHYSGLIMIYMQALRFMTDFLQNDIYYQIEYPGQNLNRAINQFDLLVSLESFLKEKQPEREFAHLSEK